MKNINDFFLISFFLLIVVSCSSDKEKIAQKNEPELEYKLFEIFDDYPALRSSFATVDKDKFNKTLAAATNENLTETKNIFDIAGRLLLPHPDNDKQVPVKLL